MEFGSTEGGWTYPLLAGPTARPFLLAALLVPCLLFGLQLTRKYVESRESWVIAAWIIGGFVLQLCLHSLYPYPLAMLVQSDQANSFYGVTQRYSAGEFLRSFHAIAATLPIHARANMPGKVFLYYLLETITTRPQALGCLIILVSDLGGVLVYLVVKKLFDDRISAAYALILYLLMPAKLYFFPLLNTVTPVFILASLWLLLKYLETRRVAYLILEGASLYLLVVFEPLPLVMGIVFVALLARAYGQRKISRADLSRVGAWVMGTFLACHLFFVAVVGFNVIRSFLFAWEDARAFNAEMGRPYSVWVVHNLKDFFINVGVVPSAVFIGLASYLVGRLVWMLRRGDSVRTYLAEPETLLTLCVLFVVAITDVIGVNRGETVRLWIFLAVFVQIVAARRCAVRVSRWGFAAVMTVTVLQAAMTISMVGFVIPDAPPGLAEPAAGTLAEH
jgi:methylthioxylose transferase